MQPFAARPHGTVRAHKVAPATDPLCGLDDRDVEVGRVELLHDRAEERQVVLLGVHVGDAAEVDEARARPAEVDEQVETTSFAAASSPERNIAVGAGSMAGSATTTAATWLPAFTTLTPGKDSWMRRPRLSSGIASVKSGFAALAMSQSTSPSRLPAPMDVEQGDRVDALDGVDHEVGVDDRLRRGEDRGGEPAAVLRVPGAEDDVVAGARRPVARARRPGRSRGWRCASWSSIPLSAGRSNWNRFTIAQIRTIRPDA